MKLIHAFAFGLFLISGAGCGTFGHLAVGGSVASTAPATTMQAEKALTISNYALQGIGTTILTVTHTGALHGQAAKTTQVWYDKADDLLTAAGKVDATANAQGLMAFVTRANDAIASADAIIHPKP